MIGSTILDYFIARRTAATVWTTSRFPPAKRSNGERDFSRSGYDSTLQSTTTNAR